VAGCTGRVLSTAASRAGSKGALAVYMSDFAATDFSLPI
jgi:hypothetical protein